MKIKDKIQEARDLCLRGYHSKVYYVLQDLLKNKEAEKMDETIQKLNKEIFVLKGKLNRSLKND